MTLAEAQYLRDIGVKMRLLAKSERYSTRARDALRAIEFELDSLLHYEPMEIARNPDVPRQDKPGARKSWRDSVTPSD